MKKERQQLQEDIKEKRNQALAEELKDLKSLIKRHFHKRSLETSFKFCPSKPMSIFAARALAKEGFDIFRTAKLRYIISFVEDPEKGGDVKWFDTDY
jgi:hypothetical protein